MNGTAKLIAQARLTALGLRADSMPSLALHVDALAAALEAAEAERDALREALAAIAEGNLGDMPWQADLARVSEFARAALTAGSGE